MATFVYVSNAGDGTIGTYAMEGNGTLRPRQRVEAGKQVMPLCVSPDQRFLFAAVRATPPTVISYAIDRATGGLGPVASGPLAESLPYICTDRTGRWLLGASYGGNLVSVNPIGEDGTVGAPHQVIPTGRNAHAIVVEATNRFVYVPHLGTDQIFQFRFDAPTGMLTANTPPVVQLAPGHGPRHMVVSGDNRFAFLLTEMTAVVTTLTIDQTTGLLAVMSQASALPPETQLRPGAPRGPVQAGRTPRDTSKDIWASDLHLTPDGRFLYAAERTSSTLGVFGVEAATGKLTYLRSTPVEKQPRGFRMHPHGTFMVVSGQRSDTISAFAIEADGSLRLLDKSPTGKDSNWVEIVHFDH